MGLLVKLIEKAEGDSGLHYRNPKLPHACSIPGGLSTGSKIYIHGMVPKEPTGFSVSLQRGADPDIAELFFHVSARFGDTPLVVFNTRSGGRWGVEEHPGSLPFTASNPFLLVIISYLDCFEIEVNGSSQSTFKVRDGLPVSNVTHLAIEGSVTIWAIHAPVESMPRNLRLSIPGCIKVGDMVFLKGKVPQGSEKFVVNVQCGPCKSDDIAFHFNPRPTEGVVVCNSRLDEQWGPEEKEGSMPFTEDRTFHLVIAASSLGYHTWVDGKEFIRFSHRQDMNTPSTLFIEGDLQTEDIAIDSAQYTLPPSCDDGFPRKLRNARSQIFCLELPFVTRITGGFEKNCLLILSGEVAKNPTSFEVNLQCDSADDADIIVHYNPRWSESDDPVLILNSREDEKWGAEVKVKDDHFGFHQGAHFEMLILAHEDAYRIIVNGIHQADFPLRIENTHPDHISINGDITVHRLLVI